MNPGSMNPYIIILYLISNLLFMFAIKRFMGMFFEKRRTSFPVMAFSYLLYFILANIERLLFNEGISHTVVVLPVLFIISLNYESPMSKRIAAIMFNYIWFTLAVAVAHVSINYLPASITIYVNDHNIGQYMAGSIISYISSFFLNRFKRIKKSNISMPFFWVSALVVPGYLIFVDIFSLLNIPHMLELLSLFFLIGIHSLIFYVYDALSAAYEDKLKSALHSQEKEHYFAQCQLMQESMEQVKSIRHDMKFHLTSLKGYVADNKKANDYLASLLGDIGESEVYSDTGNIAFDSIINFKLKNAKDNNIKLDIRLLIPSALNIEVADIVTIVGNLLDNALEAVAKVEDKTIKVDIEYNRESLFIQIDNTFDGVVIYGQEKDGEEKNIITQKEGSEHGHGLKNIQKSIEKYNGHVDITHEGNIFSAALILYVDDI